MLHISNDLVRNILTAFQSHEAGPELAWAQGDDWIEYAKGCQEVVDSCVELLLPAHRFDSYW